MSGHLLIARLDGLERALGTVTFAANDASIYLRPISTATAVYDYGRGEIPAGAADMTFVTSGQLQAAERPHISIHESGKCHVRSGQGTAVGADATNIGPLRTFGGEHVGTILVGDVRALPPLVDVWPDVGARDEDAEPWDATAPGQRGSLRVAVFVSRNQQRPRPLSHRHHEEWRRRSDGGRLSVAMEAFADAALPGSVPMVGAIGGWDPSAALDLRQASPFVFVRDQRNPV
jgi:hypothetical protein